MSEKPKTQVFYVQDPFTEEVQGRLSASDLKQRFFWGGSTDGAFQRQRLAHGRLPVRSASRRRSNLRGR